MPGWLQRTNEMSPILGRMRVLALGHEKEEGYGGEEDTERKKGGAGMLPSRSLQRMKSPRF